LQLKNGEFHSIAFEDGIPSGIFAHIMSDTVGWGDLDGNSSTDAVVVIYMSAGGSASTPGLIPVVSRPGGPASLGAVGLSDRDGVESLRIDNGVLTANLLVHGPEDALCCPSVQETVRYRLVAGQLQQIGAKTK